MIRSNAFLPTGLTDLIKAIDGGTFANLQLFEQFAAAAYCPSNNNVPNGGPKLTCPTSDNCPLVEADDVTTVYEFQKYASRLFLEMLSFYPQYAEPFALAPSSPM